jgi:hypothetical protein
MLYTFYLQISLTWRVIIFRSKVVTFLVQENQIGSLYDPSLTEIQNVKSDRAI